MPKGTVSKTPVRKSLKSCPPDGFVKLRKLPYGMMLDRRDNSSSMSMRGEDESVDFKLKQRWTRMYEFQHCIIEHNIEDEDGTLFNFSNELSFDLLDPEIGMEIEKYIDELHGEADEQEKATFPKPPDASLQEEIPSGSTAKS